MKCIICGRIYGSADNVAGDCPECLAVIIANAVPDSDEEDAELEAALDAEEDEERGPQDEDLVTNDYIEFWRVGMGKRRPAVVVPDGEEWQDAVKAYMDKQSYWPDVWLEEERGGYRNITMEGP